MLCIAQRIRISRSCAGVQFSGGRDSKESLISEINSSAKQMDTATLQTVIPQLRRYLKRGETFQTAIKLAKLSSIKHGLVAGIIWRSDLKDAILACNESAAKLKLAKQLREIELEKLPDRNWLIIEVWQTTLKERIELLELRIKKNHIIEQLLRINLIKCLKLLVKFRRWLRESQCSL